jgi:hypothetical protein
VSPRVASASAFVTGLLLALGGCRSAPAEPDSPGAASAAAAAAEAVAPLAWEVPPTWSIVPARGGPQKAAYRTPKAGDAKADAEVFVFFPGTGSVGDAEKAFAAWSAEFESETGDKPKRALLDGTKLPAETIEAAGKYKIAVGPHAGKKSAVSMMREHYRLVGAVVKTTDRGNWFFKMTGPEDAVAASRDAFLTMVRSAR